jgi:glucokinase
MTDTRTLISPADAKPPYFVGVDLGGSSVKTGILDDLGQTLLYHSFPTEIERGPDDAARRMAGAVAELIGKLGLRPSEVKSLGLGSPGTMDLRAGVLLDPVNLPGWQNFPLRDRLRQYCGMPVTFANDAGAAAFGEFWAGSGKQFQSLAMFTLGTGIGCGIIINGVSVDGSHSTGAECGHTLIDFHPDGRLCSCGQTGHLEAYASATALVKRTIEALESGMKTSLNARIDRGAKLTPLILAEEAEAGDTLSLELIVDTAKYLAVGIVNVMHTVDPDGVLLGGAMTFGGKNSTLGQRFLATIQEEVRRRAFPILAAETTIDYASLGSDAGYIGAAGLARAEHARLSARG